MSIVQLITRTFSSFKIRPTTLGKSNGRIMAKKHTCLAWAVTVNLKPDWDIRRAFSPEECWRLALQKFNAKTKRQLRKLGVGIVRVKITEIPVGPWEE